MAITRRQFINRVGRAGGFGAATLTMQALGQLAVADGAVASPNLPVQSGRGVSVAVLGAGIAGLTAAYELTKAGYDCRVFEASERVGGRCRTLRRGDRVAELDIATQSCEFDEGLYFNCGPARISSTHRALLAYCKEFGVELEVFINDNRNTFFQDDNVLDGKPVEARQVHYDSAGYISELLAKALNQGALDSHLTQEDKGNLLGFVSEFGALAPDFTYQGSHRLGEVTSVGDHPGTTHQKRPIALKDLLDSRFWWWKMHLEKSLEQQTTMLQPVGGMDRIAEAFGAHLKEHTVLNAAITRLNRVENGVEIVYQDRRSGEEQIHDANYCVCTLPLPVLATLEADFSPRFRTAINRIDYASALKLGWQAETRFWEEGQGIYGGISYTEHEISELWYPCSSFHSPKGILVGAHALYENAVAFGNLPPDRRAILALEGGAKLHPQMSQMVGNSISVAWHKMPFQRGAWAKWHDEDRKSAYQTLLEPDGRVYLAGDHLSEFNGWQEGAVRSAHRVVQAIAEKIAQANE